MSVLERIATVITYFAVITGMAVVVVICCAAWYVAYLSVVDGLESIAAAMSKL